MGHKSSARKESRERDSRRYESLLAFVHIPRSGGGTVTTAIADSYARPKSAGNIQRSPEKARRGVQTVGADPSRWGAIADHTPYGLYHRYLPPETLYMTFLRDPVDRVLSHYQFHAKAGGGKVSGIWNRLASFDAAERASDPTAGLTQPIDYTDTSLEAGLANRIVIYDNLATRFLWGGESIFGALPADALERAKENISRFALVGVTDRLDESLVLLGRELGTGLMPYRLRHVNPDRRNEQVPDELRESIREHNELDVELYRFGRELFETKADSAPELAEDAQRLRQLSESAAEAAAADAARNPPPEQKLSPVEKSVRRGKRGLEAVGAAHDLSGRKKKRRTAGQS